MPENRSDFGRVAGKCVQIFLGRSTVLPALLADVELFVNQVAGNLVLAAARETRRSIRRAAWDSRG